VAAFAALGACSKQTAPPAAPADETPTKAEAKAAHQLDACRGRRASMIEWSGMGYHRRILGCAEGAFVVLVEWEEAHGESPPDQSVDVDAETWEAAWASLEEAGWRTMTSDCPETEEPESWQNTGVDFEITDGKTTVKFSCNGQPNETHLAVYDVLDQAGDLVGDDEEEDSEEEENGEVEEAEGGN
jgi:hypothetical protein